MGKTERVLSIVGALTILLGTLLANSAAVGPLHFLVSWFTDYESASSGWATIAPSDAYSQSDSSAPRRLDQEDVGFAELLDVIAQRIDVGRPEGIQAITVSPYMGGGLIESLSVVLKMSDGEDVGVAEPFVVETWLHSDMQHWALSRGLLVVSLGVFMTIAALILPLLAPRARSAKPDSSESNSTRTGNVRHCSSWLVFWALTSVLIAAPLCAGLLIRSDVDRTVLVRCLAILAGSYLVWALAARHLRTVYEREKDSDPADLRRYAEERRYHNEAIYKDFALFVKVTLALTGGLIYLALRFDAELPLLIAGGSLQCLVGLLSAYSIFSHQRSKAKHWKALEDNEHPSNKWRIYPGFLLWQETAVVVSILTISFSIGLALVPVLLR